jgi:hypothetical protein
MTEAYHDGEHVLERLIAEYPDVLGGDQIRPSQPRRWLFITREAGMDASRAESVHAWRNAQVWA